MTWRRDGQNRWDECQVAFVLWISFSPRACRPHHAAGSVCWIHGPSRTILLVLALGSFNTYARRGFPRLHYDHGQASGRLGAPTLNLSYVSAFWNLSLLRPSKLTATGFYQWHAPDLGVVHSVRHPILGLQSTDPSILSFEAPEEHIEQGPGTVKHTPLHQLAGTGIRYLVGECKPSLDPHIDSMLLPSFCRCIKGTPFPHLSSLSAFLPPCIYSTILCSKARWLILQA